jgi:hypothetical protein
MVMSATFPGVSAKATGLPRSSAKAWILLVLPPRERPIASANSPFLNQPPTVRLDMAAVDGKLVRNWTGGRFARPAGLSIRTGEASVRP